MKYTLTPKLAEFLSSDIGDVANNDVTATAIIDKLDSVKKKSEIEFTENEAKYLAIHLDYYRYKQLASSEPRIRGFLASLKVMEQSFFKFN